MTKQEIRKEWARALRSGAFAQGTQRLYNPKDHTFCCLGVLTKMAVNAGVVDYADLEAGLYLDPKVMEWAGLCERSGEYDKKTLNSNGRVVHESLSLLNDYNHASFRDIADIIEQEPEGLFCDK